MGLGIILGILGGVAAAKLIRACSYRWGHGGCGHGHGPGQEECGPGGGGSWGGGRGWGGWGRWGRHGHGGAFRLFWLARHLDLDARQRDEAWRLFGELRRSVGNLRDGKEQAIGSVLDALSQESFDRSRIDTVAGEQAGALNDIKEQFIRSLEQLHQILTPSQRERLRSLLAGGGGDPSCHPYRGQGGGPGAGGPAVQL